MSPNQTFDPNHERRTLRRLLVATGVGFAGLLSAVVLLGAFYHYLGAKSEDFIQILQRRTGLDIRVGQKTIGLKQIDFKQVSISGNPGSVIQHIRVTTDLSEAQVDHLDVRGAILNLTTHQLQQLGQFFVPKTGLQATLSLAKPSARLIPQVLQVEIPKLQIWYDGKPVIVIKQLNILHSEKQAKGNLTFASIEVNGKRFLPAGDATLQGSISSGNLRIRLHSQDNSGKDLLVLSGIFDKRKKQASIRLRGGGINWGVIPGVSKYLVNHRTLPIALNTNLKFGRKGRLLLSWSANTGKGAFFHPKLAKQALFPIMVKSQGQLGLDFKARELTVYNSQWSVGQKHRNQVTVHVGLKVALAQNKQGALVGGYIKLPPTSCQNILEALPENSGEVFPDFYSPTGNAGGVLRFRFHSNEPSQFAFKLSEDVLSCQFRSDEPRYHLSRLMGKKAVVSNFQLANRYVSEYPYNSFVALEKIPPHVRDAFLVSEDAGFYRHDGFSLATFEAALRRNLKEGRAALGASTITMQTAKNLWLSGEKTFSRKLQEALLTVYLEDVLTKDRILEMYLNMVEFGPGLYGLKNAADHFFDKTVQELNSLEAVYLASLLPSPVRRYTYFCRGYVTPGYRKIMDQKLEWMVQYNKIDQTSYEAAKRARLAFDQTNRESAQYCPMEALRFSSNATN